MYKNLHFKESLENVKDVLELSNKENISNKNYIRMVDKNSGKILINRRENIVTHRGRTFALEKLYEDVNDSSDYPIKNHQRIINLFSVGSGGCQVGSPFDPILPTPLDTNLTTPIPFKETSAGNAVDIDLAKYPVAPTVSVLSGKDLYYHKRFKILDPEWLISRNTNTVYKKLELLIDMDDCRTSINNDDTINELGLYFSTDTFTQPELYSRVTFPTEPLTGNKKILVEYYTFA